MPNIIDILARALSLRQETALNSITPNRAGGIMYDTLLVLNQMQLEGGSLLISKVYASVSAMEADTTPTSDLTGRALKPGQLVVIVTSDSSSSDMGSEYRFNGPGSWTYVGKVGGLPLDTVPTQSSTKGITSGGVYTALAAMKAEGYKYMGLATPGSGGTAPGTPNQPVFYIAGPGSYPNFGSITVASGYLGFIKYSGGSWTVESVAVGKDYDEEISQLRQEVTDLIEGSHFNHTFDSSEFDNIIWDGTKFNASNANYNSFIFPLKEGVTYNVGGTFGNISLFAVQPVIGVEAQYIRRLGASTTSFVPTAAEKWALVSIVVASFTSFSLAYDVQGIQDDINDLQDQIDDVNDRIDNLDVSTENISEGGQTQKEINAEFREAINDTLYGEIRITDFKNKLWDGTAISDNSSFWSCELNVEKYDKIHLASDQPIIQVRFFASEPFGTPAPTSQIKQIALPADGYVDTAGYDWIMITYARNIHPTYVDVKFDSLADVVEKQGEEIAALDAKVNPDVADLSFYDKTRMYDKTNYGKPIVAFCFDRFVSTLFNLFDTKGLRATFAVDGGTTANEFKANLKSTGYWNLFPKGFDMVTHGVDSYVGRNIGQSGVCSEDESSTRLQFEAIRSQFRACGLKDDMLVYFNSTVNCPATFDIVSEYYKVGIGWENGSSIRGINPFDVDFRFVDRCWIERDVYTLDVLKNMVLDNLNRPVLLLFGTHSNDVLNSGKIEPFLDFLKGLVDAGAIINVGLHEAIGIIENYRKCYNVIPQKVNIYKLRGGEVFKYNGTAYRCVTEGVPALYKITVTGTPQSGSFEISLDGSGNQRIIATTGEMSANDVAMRFYTHGTYKQYRTTVVGNVVYMQRSRTDEANASLSIINNTSGMTFTVEQVVAPVASVYTEI